MSLVSSRPRLTTLVSIGLVLASLAVMRASSTALLLGSTTPCEPEPGRGQWITLAVSSTLLSLAVTGLVLGLLHLRGTVFSPSTARKVVTMGAAAAGAAAGVAESARIVEVVRRSLEYGCGVGDLSWSGAGGVWVVASVVLLAAASLTAIALTCVRPSSAEPAKGQVSPSRSASAKWSDG
jgi:hypothetical protein